MKNTRTPTVRVSKSTGLGPKVRRAPKATKTASPLPLPTQEEVARRAFEIFLGRNGSSGDPVSDWLQAERELAAM